MKTSVLILSLVFSTVIANAGVKEGGGGKGVVCRNTEGGIASVETLDLWEARTLYLRSLPTELASEEALIESAIEILKLSFTDLELLRSRSRGVDYLRDRLNEEILHLKSEDESITRRLRNVTLALTDDSYELARPSANCHIEQIVTYVDDNPDGSADGVRYINQDLVEAMSPLSRAALYLHEAVYRILRDRYQEPNSIRVRRLVGLALSTTGLTAPRFDSDSQMLWCYGRRLHATRSDLILITRGEPSAYGRSFEVRPIITYERAAIEQPAIKFPFLSKNLELLFNPTAASSAGQELEGYPLTGSGSVDFDQKFGSVIVKKTRSTVEVYLSPTTDSSVIVSPSLKGAIKLKCEKQ